MTQWAAHTPDASRDAFFVDYTQWAERSPTFDQAMKETEMIEDGLQFIVPWEDIKARLEERANGAKTVAANRAAKDDPCNRGIRQAAERDAKLFAWLARYAPDADAVELTRSQIEAIFLDQEYYGDNRNQAETSGVRW